ncbi:hypothetical protein EXVG_00007 [Emiliania huxleyi virus 202]|nr:hypothetical protein EXVG_00007 [Emiliania huxleyi virus 202]AHA54547.1 hypothetical protein EhV18_00501 [Emiliania huxleyi virus 18]AHA55586.1 hypothetical protein EhV156_00491 [Emiliania huxleyi virus 156]
MKTITLTSGNKAYVGENARDNENMVLFFNESNAVWMHLEDDSGPHVIIEDASPADIKEAAVYTRGGITGRCSVMHCHIRELSKDHKCAVGEFVTHDKYRTITLKQ